MLDIDPIELKGEFIAFKFEEHVNATGQFDEQGNGIIIIANNTSHQESASKPRYATVLKVGPEVKDPAIVPGTRILIAPLRWSMGIPTPSKSDEKFHVTKESELLGIWEE